MTKTIDLSLTLKASELEKEPLTFALVASEDEKAGLVERFGLVSLKTLEADVAIRNKGNEGGVLISGQLRASLVQRCIVSLNEVPEQIDVPFELLLVDPEMADRMDLDESYLDPDAVEYDALEGDLIEVGEVVAQTLSISMEPYPKAENAAVEAPKNPKVSLNAPELDKPNPFAVLSNLKDKS